tara:strand:+ start:52 stop:267 length:216 start_codon:yes stop_codon:yes gene_type:complete
MTTTYKPMFNFGEYETQTNGLVFATRDEAYANASDKFRVWTMPTGFDVIESSDPVNYVYDFNTNSTQPLRT